MKTLKINILALLALLLATAHYGVAATAAPAATPTPAAAPKDGINQIKAFIVVGDVRIMDVKGVTSPLRRNDVVPVGSTILTGPSGSTLLAFSNGSAMQVKSGSELYITKFEQADFDTSGGDKTFLRLMADPSKSTTVLDIRNGTLTGEVRKLNQAAGSTFIVNTPAGSANIHGTLPTFTVNRDVTGKVTGVNVSCAQGTFTFTPAGVSTIGGAIQQYGSVNVEQGGQLVMGVTENTSGQLTGISVKGEAFTGADAQTVITGLYDAINQVRADQGLPPLTPPPPAPPNPPETSGGGGGNPLPGPPETDPTTISVQ